MRLLGIAESGVRAQQLALDTNADNVANVNTPGFKSKRVDFAETLSMQQAGQGADGGNGASASAQSWTVGTGVSYAAISRDLGQGMLVETGNPLDWAIEGEGFFQVALADGQTGYTRVGSFHQDGEGKIVNSQGYALYPEVIVPAAAENLTISTDGTIRADVNGQNQVLGEVSLARFSNAAGLTDAGNGIFVPSVASGDPQVGTPGKDDLGLVRANSLEQSNVDLATELTDLIQIQRAYQVNARLIQDGDKMWEIANSLRR